MNLNCRCMFTTSTSMYSRGHDLKNMNQRSYSSLSISDLWVVFFLVDLVVGSEFVKNNVHREWRSGGSVGSFASDSASGPTNRCGARGFGLDKFCRHLQSSECLGFHHGRTASRLLHSWYSSSWTSRIMVTIFMLLLMMNITHLHASRRCWGQKSY